MSPTSDWNTYQHSERSEYEVENAFVLISVANLYFSIIQFSIILYFIILSSWGHEEFVGTGRIVPFAKDWSKTLIYCS